METLIEHHETIAALIVRVFLGLLFFFQGYDVVFNVKVINAVNAYQNQFERNGIPRFLTVCGAWFTSYSELIGGLLLVPGLFEYAALCVLGLNLVVASIAFGINTPVWDTKHVFPRLVLIIFLLCIPHQWHALSLDNFFFNK